MTYVLYTNDRGSFIVPKDQFKAKKFTHSFEIDAPDEVNICDKKIKLSKPVTSVDDVNGVLSRLFREKEDGEYDKE